MGIERVNCDQVKVAVIVGVHLVICRELEGVAGILILPVIEGVAGLGRIFGHGVLFVVVRGDVLDRCAAVGVEVDRVGQRVVNSRYRNIGFTDGAGHRGSPAGELIAFAERLFIENAVQAGGHRIFSVVVRQHVAGRFVRKCTDAGVISDVVNVLRPQSLDLNGLRRHSCGQAVGIPAGEGPAGAMRGLELGNRHIRSSGAVFNVKLIDDRCAIDVLQLEGVKAPLGHVVDIRSGNGRAVRVEGDKGLGRIALDIPAVEDVTGLGRGSRRGDHRAIVSVIQRVVSGCIRRFLEEVHIILIDGEHGVDRRGLSRHRGGNRRIPALEGVAGLGRIRRRRHGCAVAIGLRLIRLAVHKVGQGEGIAVIVRIEHERVRRVGRDRAAHGRRGRGVVRDRLKRVGHFGANQTLKAGDRVVKRVVVIVCVLQVDVDRVGQVVRFPDCVVGRGRLGRLRAEIPAARRSIGIGGPAEEAVAHTGRIRIGHFNRLIEGAVRSQRFRARVVQVEGVGDGLRIQITLEVDVRRADRISVAGVERLGVIRIHKIPAVEGVTGHDGGGFHRVGLTHRLGIGRVLDRLTFIY